MFQTEKLQQIIDQLLQHSSGRGYFETLGLILKLIGHCICPILFVIGVIVISYLFPKYVAKKRVPIDSRLKRYTVKYRADNHELQFRDICETDEYKRITEKRARIRINTRLIMFLVEVLLFSPFMFMNSDVMGGIYCTFVVFVGLVLLAIMGSTYYDGSRTYGFIENEDEAPEARKRVKELIKKELSDLNRTETKLSRSEFENLINEKLSSDFCEVEITEYED